MIQEERIQRINRQPVREGRYVLYWMQAAQRARCNHALEYAIDRANELGRPVVVVFGLEAGFPEANARHFHFLLGGLRGTQRELRERGVQMVVRAKSPTACVPDLAREACEVVVDAGHLRPQRQWRAEVGQALGCALVEVETNLIVPVEEAADKENFSAGTFRPRIYRKLDAYLVGVKPRTVRKDSLGLKLDSLDLGDIDRLLRSLKVDASVGKVEGFVGGADEAQRRLDEFLANRLDAYPTDRNDPNLDGQSHLSPYLHFGQVSPLDVALQARQRGGGGLDAFLEELIVRRELSHNFVHYNPNWTVPCSGLSSWRDSQPVSRSILV